MGKWQLIETAPRNYTPVLLHQEGTVGEGCHANHVGWEFFNPSYVLRRNPSHWKPVPVPPKSGADAMELEPVLVEDRDLWLTCEACGGTGSTEKNHPFPDDPDFCEVHRCEECGGSGRICR